MVDEVFAQYEWTNEQMYFFYTFAISFFPVRDFMNLGGAKESAKEGAKESAGNEYFFRNFFMKSLFMGTPLVSWFAYTGNLYI